MTTQGLMRFVTELKSPWFHLAKGSIDSMTDAAWPLATNQSSRIVVRFVRGKKMMCLDALFDECGAALQFPYYFGENWPAFDECINDLDWLPGEAYLLIITDSHKLLCKDNSELPTLLKVLQGASSRWSETSQITNKVVRPPAPFHTVFQCEAPEYASLRLRLELAGHAFDEMGLEESGLR